MNTILQIFIIGFSILIGAIIINTVASYLNISTWYSLIINMKEIGFFNAFKKEGFNLIWLLIIYPFLLGLIGYYITKII